MFLIYTYLIVNAIIHPHPPDPRFSKIFVQPSFPLYTSISFISPHPQAHPPPWAPPPFPAIHHKFYPILNKFIQIPTIKFCDFSSPPTTTPVLTKLKKKISKKKPSPPSTLIYFTRAKIPYHVQLNLPAMILYAHEYWGPSPSSLISPFSWGRKVRGREFFFFFVLAKEHVSSTVFLFYVHEG